MSLKKGQKVAIKNWKTVEAVIHLPGKTVSVIRVKTSALNNSVSFFPIPNDRLTVV